MNVEKSYQNVYDLGLQIWLNMKPYSIQLYGKATEYSLGVSNKRTFIDQKRNMIRLKPGNQVFIRVLPRLFATTENFDMMDKKDRKCKLPHETAGFRFLKEYSRIGCEFECAANQAMSICNCIPWYYPNDFDKWPICEMFGGFCFDVIMTETIYYKKCPSHCLVECKETAFSVYTSISPLNLDSVCHMGSFHHQHFEQAFSKHFAFYSYKSLFESGSLQDLEKRLANGSFCQEYVQNYVTYVSVQSPTTGVIRSEDDQRVSFYDKLGIVGGTMGLFLGMSLLSFFEFLFLIFDIALYFKRQLMIAIGLDSEDQECYLSSNKIKMLEESIYVSTLRIPAAIL